MKRSLILVSVVSLIVAGTASASVQKGDTELNFLAGYVQVNSQNANSDVDAFWLAGGVGYFVTDQIQVGGAAMGAWIDPDGPAKLKVYGLGGRAAYHFMTDNTWVPYVGGQVLWTTIDPGAGAADIDGLLWGPVVGLRYELNEMNDFFIELQYIMFEEDFGDNSPTNPSAIGLDDAWMILLGIIHQFK